MPTDHQFLEDLTPGRRFGSGSLEVPAEAIARFDAEFGPQGAAPASVASPAHVASLTMRLLVDSALRPEGGMVGGGVEDLQWFAAVRPGDVLHIESEVVDARPSRSRPELGVVRVRTTTLNQQGEAVQAFVASILVRRRPDPVPRQERKPTTGL